MLAKNEGAADRLVRAVPSTGLVALSLRYGVTSGRPRGRHGPRGRGAPLLRRHRLVHSVPAVRDRYVNATNGRPSMIAVTVHACPQNHPCPAVQYCPEGAIIQDDIYSAPRIDEGPCTECGACTKVCRVFSKVQDEVPVG